jgi:hypothetical protein
MLRVAKQALAWEKPTVLKFDSTANPLGPE